MGEGASTGRYPRYRRGQLSPMWICRKSQHEVRGGASKPGRFSSANATRHGFEECVLPGRTTHCRQRLGCALQEPLLPDRTSVQLATSQEKSHGTRAFGQNNSHGLQEQGGPLHRNQGVTPEALNSSSKATNPWTEEEIRPSSGSSLEKIQYPNSTHHAQALPV